MRQLKTIILVALFALAPLCAHALPAFPGAEGFGANAAGGRGGTVYVVDTLSDDPADGMTLREACAASGPRIVTFAVSGVIDTSALPIEILNPYITIAGQTSPGGVCVAGYIFMVETHDVVITHMRFRTGSTGCDNPPYPWLDCDSGGDSFRIMSSAGHDAYNIIVDHCSMSWGNDETVDISRWYGDTYGITISNCLIGQGLDDPAPEGEHALGALVSGKFPRTNRRVTVTFHDNYFCHFRYRMPEVSEADVDLYNNVMYNYNDFSTSMDYANSTPATLNTRGNYYKPGPSTGGYNDCINAPNKHIGLVYGYDASHGLLAGTPYPIVHSSGNVGCLSIGDTTGKIANGDFTLGFPWTPSGWISPTPLTRATAGDSTVTTMSSQYASMVVANAGATKPVRDSVDTGFVNDYLNNTGSWLGDMHYGTNPWPTYTNTTPPTDADADGMPDSWETTNGVTDPNGFDLDGDYTNLEVYLFIAGGYSESADLSAPTVTITGPTMASSTATTAAIISLSGTASDNQSITSVTWANSRGGSGAATGITAWSIDDIPLLGGINIITVTASDGSNTSTDTITVTRLIELMSGVVLESGFVVP